MREKALETCVILAIASLVLLEILSKKHPWGIYLAGILLVVGVFLKPVSIFIHKVWMKLSEAIGSIISKALLLVLFFIFLTPLALIKRLLSKRDILMLSQPENSCLKNRKHSFSKEDFERTF